ncbi:Heat shock 70 kDa protein 12A [Entomortierella beljakovae]|nr:Heat shock 70 kDa protein 12A [Entomortierella beljakovae]
MTVTDFNHEDYPIIVSIDFGTTFSGCAFAYAPEDKEPRMITEWPNHNIQYSKAPTLGLYQKLGEKYKMVDWGWNSKLKMETPAASNYVQLYKFKPYLDEYITEHILGQFGPSFSQKKFRYCLTIPAIWSDRAKDVMRKAAIRANLITEADHMDRLTLVSEPEAAALYCEKACDKYDVKHGEQFMICDAGGGTVDLIVYRIDDSNGERRLSEVTRGHGASCGSMFIDLNFGNLLIEKFSSQTNAPFPKNIIPRLIEKYAFEHKPSFNGETEQYLPIPRDSFFESFQDLKAIGMDGGYICLNASEMQEKVFEPVVVQVLELIHQQLESVSECSAIFMVGGFGSSEYLRNRAKQEFGLKVRTIASPHKPEAAVVCGAVYAGLKPKVVTTRITRRCYGVKCFMPFEHGVDLFDKKIERPNGLRCKDRFSTIVQKGQMVGVDEYFSREYGFVNSKDNIYKVDIYAVDEDPPRYTTSARVKELASITLPDPFLPSDPDDHEVIVIPYLFYYEI